MQNYAGWIYVNESVEIDDRIVGTSEWAMKGGAISEQAFRHYPLDDILPGSHVGRYTLSVNPTLPFLVDWVSTNSTRQNNPPSTPGVTTLDGFGSSRSMGWTNRAYAFALSTIFGDPEFDAVWLDWRWGDGSTARTRSLWGYVAEDTTASHSWRNPGPYGVTLQATDDPSWRCSDIVAKASIVSNPLAFTIVADWMAQFTQPGLAQGCLGGTFMPVGAPIMNGKCTVVAAVSTNQAPTSAVEQAKFYVDNQLKAVDSQSPYSFVYDSSLFPDGPHQLRVCFDALNDKYDRAFCQAITIVDFR